jgi:hypothetical protein
MNGSLTLRDYPGDVVRLACEKCGRRGQYWKQSLLVRFGVDIALPDLRVEIAQCERQDSMQDPCGVHFIGLT